MRLWRKKSNSFLSPDEIFLDTSDIPGFERERFEGVIEQPLSRGSFYMVAVIGFLIGSLLLGRTAWLSVARGEELAGRAERNYIRKTYADAPRGTIFDKNGTAIVFNESYLASSTLVEYRRTVKHPFAFSHLVGYLGQPSESDVSSGIATYGMREVGKTGIERFYNDSLRGIPGERDEELDATGQTVARGPLKEPVEGKALTLTIDAPLQEALYERLAGTMEERGFKGGAGIVFSVKDGSILALVSVPSFNLEAFGRGLTHEEARDVFQNSRTPLFNRAVAGTFAPGSIMKPFIAIAALEEGVIDEFRNIYSSGQLELPNPFGGPPSIFRDWKAHGYVDMREAIAVSSDVYFYTIGGGFGDIKGLGVYRIKSWLQKFGFDTVTGIDLGGEDHGFLPDPEWKEKTHTQNPIWRVGDTYNTSIGQGDVTIAPLSMMRGLMYIANGGRAATPHIIKGAEPHFTTIDGISLAHYNVVREGMRKAGEVGGTAQAISWLPFPVAAKTGTAEIGKKDRVNSWIINYAPYDDPQIGMVILLESGARSNLVGSPYVASEVYRWILDNGGIERLVH
ncbi:MAG: penicillin-binding transpeptidase domain-containing protein [Patescibacteria group bacterium]